MRPSELKLKFGEIVQAEIEESLGSNIFIASIGGQLLRVEIKCNLKLKKADRVWLEVFQRNPLVFKWLP